MDAPPALDVGRPNRSVGAAVKRIAAMLDEPSACSHSLSAHKTPGQTCAWCPTVLTADMIATANRPHRGSQHARSGGEPAGRMAVVPSGAPIAPEAAGLCASGATVVAGGNLLRPPATLFDTRPDDPITSHMAAASVTLDMRADRYRAVLAILAEGPASDFDLAARTGLKQTSIGKRRGELRDAGLVRKLDDLGVSDTGSACIRWALTDAGVAAAPTSRRVA